MASERAWADAFFAQAKEDLRGAEASRSASPSVLCMLLQMVFEKTAKAALLRSRLSPLRQIEQSHKAASKLVDVLKREQQYLKMLGGGNPYLWKDILPLVQELERAHPQLAGRGPKLEYPWEDPVDGSVRWPARDLPIVKRMTEPKDTSGPRLLKLAQQIVQHFNTLFP